MKKTKRLLAMLLAVVMLLSAASVNVYAFTFANEYREPGVTASQKYYFTPEQGAGYILDMVDKLLDEQQIFISWSWLADQIGSVPLINVEGALKDHLGGNAIDGIDLRSIDGLIATIYYVVGNIADPDIIVKLALAFMGNVKDQGLNANGINVNTNRQYSSDLTVLYMLVTWLSNNATFLRNVLTSGKVTFGSLGGTLSGLKVKGFKLTNSDDALDLEPFLRGLLYSILIDSSVSADTMPSGVGIDHMLQQLIDYALVTGTGESAATGANSLLGANHEPLLPGLANEPGAATIGKATIQADRDEDGVAETVTMNVYQLVSNAINALLNDLIAPMLGGLIADLVGIESTEEYPDGDPAMMNDMVFSLIISAVEGILVQNGAPEPTYSEYQNTYPIAKINAMMDWLFDGGALDVFLHISYNGLKLTDNFMSLLNDLIRLAIPLLPVLGIDLGSIKLYSSEELNEVYYYNSNYQLCSEDDEDAVALAYRSYETDSNGENYILYKEGEAYYYLSDRTPANTANPSASDYINPTFIRSAYVKTVGNVWANVVKGVMPMFIEGCYFPEWTDSVASVVAYGLASMAAKILPEQNFFERLDAYHYEQIGETYTSIIDPDLQIESIPYTMIHTYTNYKGQTTSVEIPYAALKVGMSVLAYYMNGWFDFTVNMSQDTTLEQFAAEFLVWGFQKYLPMMTGTRNSSTGLYSGGTWTTEVNTFINAIYSNPANYTYKDNPSWDTIYYLIDNTLFDLIPESWLPTGLNGSFDVINEWLLNSVMNINLQKLIGLFVVREGGELEEDVTTVIIRVVDRVLALVMNNNALLLDTGRTDCFSQNTFVSSFDFRTTADITSADGTSGYNYLIKTNSGNSVLPTLVYTLCVKLNENKVPLFETVLPLVAAMTYERPYDQATLGTDMTTRKVADLESYVDYIGNMSNAVYILDKGPYATKEEAEAACDKSLGEFVSRRTVTPEGYDDYVIARPSNIYDAAQNAVTATDAAGEYTQYSGFALAQMIDKNSSGVGLVRYERNYNRSYGSEDFRGTSYAYTNSRDAATDAAQFVTSYRSFTTKDLPESYADWMLFSIEMRLYAAGIYDKNDDGVVTTDTASEVYDGRPNNPSLTSMYPFSTSDSTVYSYYNDFRDKVDNVATTVTMNSMTAGNYEQIDLAVKYGQDHENDVVLDVVDTEKVVRLAIGSIAFDITLNESNEYNADSIQWDGLTEDQIAQINSLCTSLGWTFDAEKHTITRPAFALITSAMLGGSFAGVPVKPATSKYVAPEGGSLTDDETLSNVIFNTYENYVKKLNDNRKSLYNQIDIISYRTEMAESLRSNSVNILLLQWLMAKVEHAYINPASNLRNQKIVGSNGTNLIYSKVYTNSTYEAFRNAYDFADCITQAASGSIQGNGLTQSLVSDAYTNLLDAYQSLVLYTGAADFTQLQNYIDIASGMINDPNANDPELGYTAESLQALVDELAEAVEVRDDPNIDCEAQAFVDTTAANLYSAINSIVYNTRAKLTIPEEIQDVVSDVVMSETGRIVAQLIGFTVGEGLTDDCINGENPMVNISGMRVDPSIGNDVYINPSSRGYGTGSYIRGDIASIEQFRYYCVIYGDVNGDAAVDGTDKSYVEYAIQMNTNNPAYESSGGINPQRYEAADVNHDGTVDAEDANVILQYYNYQTDIDQTVHSTSEG